MPRQPSTPGTSAPVSAVRTVFLVLLGVAGLVLKPHYTGPYQDLVRSYGGNIAASFAVYFVVSNLRLPAYFVGLGPRLQPLSRHGRLLTATAALLVVELFEVTNGFGVMTNVYDPVDLAANACGVALAVAVDAFTPNELPPPPRRD